MKKPFSIVSILLVAVCCLSQPATAKKCDDFVKLPVLFITDREPAGDSYGPYRALEKETVSHVETGMAQVSIPVKRDEHLADWQQPEVLEHTHNLAKPALTKFPGTSTLDLSTGFDEALRQLLSKYHTKRFILFVHGFNNNFNTALSRAAELCHSAGCPVVCYSWPSVGKLTQYTVDEGNNEWSQEHFNQVLEHFLKLKKSDGLQIDLVAHSLGNRLLVRAGPIVSGTGIFSDMFLVYPDMDAQTCVHYLARYVPATGPVEGVHCRLLISRRDKALAISERLFGGYTRLGQGTDFSLTALTRPDLFLNIWQLPRRLAELPDLPAWMKPVIIAKIEEAFRIFDVTAIDSGIIGHKIPYDFIGWMRHQSTPQPGFKFEEVECQGLNKLARRFEKSSKQQPTRLLGKVWMVVKAPEETNKKQED